MSIYNNLTKTYPIIAHCPGEETPLWNQLVKNVKKIQTDLTIITWNNLEHESILEKSCNCHVLGKGITNWNNRMKICLTAEFLENCKSNYVMGIDAFDAIVLDDPIKILPIKQKMLFNATNGSFPTMPNIEIFDNSIRNNYYKHLNAGVWIGETTFCLKFFKQAEKLSKTDFRHPHSEQFIIRQMAAFHYPFVDIDSNCTFFQLIDGFNVVMDTKIYI